MSTETNQQSAPPAITIPIRATLELSGGWEDLPELPEHLGAPEVQWGFDDEGRIETNISLIVDGSEETASFWATEQDGICNTAEDTFGSEDTIPTPWEELAAEDLDAACRWGNAVHIRICDAAQQVTETAAAAGSGTYAAVVAYATDTPVPDDERTPKAKALSRAEAALALNQTDTGTGSGMDELEAMMVTFWHLAKEKGLRLQSAVDCAYATFDLERNDPDFINGITADEEPSQTLTLWTTENSEAVIWGTHDLSAAREAYEASDLGGRPDWDRVRSLWGTPALLDLEVWDTADYGPENLPGRVPFLVCDL